MSQVSLLLSKAAKVMALCLEGSVLFTQHGKNLCRNPINVTNVLIWIRSIPRFGSNYCDTKNVRYEN